MPTHATADILRRLFERSRAPGDGEALVALAAEQLAAQPGVAQVVVVVQENKPPFTVRALSWQGLSEAAARALAAWAPVGSGLVQEAWPPGGVPPELAPGARFCVAPLDATGQQITLCCAGGDEALVGVVGTFLALALERESALSDARRLAELFNAGPVVIFRWRNQPGWPVEFVSENVTKVFGWPRGALLEHPYAPWVHPEDLGRVEREVAAAVASQVPYFAQQYRVLDPAGQARELYDFTHVVRDAAGEATHFHGYVFDDSERARAERTKAELLHQLQNSQKLQAVGTLASGIAHDFNNILAAILAHVELACLDPALTNHPDLTAATQAAVRGRDLVRQLLVFGRSRAEERFPVRVQRIIEDSMRMVRSTMPSTIGLRLSLDPRAVAVRADPTQLQQVLVNLVNNAAQAMPEGGTVDIAVEAVPGPPPRVELRVTDTGVGMTPAVRARAFEPFFTTRNVGRGTGLGLAMVHAIVEAHGGSTTLFSAPGEGTRVVVSLPAAGEEELPPEAPQRPAPAGNQQRVAVVDDEPSVARATERLVQHFGYQPTGLASGQAVLDAFAQRPGAFDLVLTDQTMPGMTGLQLAQALRERGLRVPVLLVTGLPTEVDPAAVAPPFAVVGKPYRSEELARALASLLAEARR